MFRRELPGSAVRLAPLHSTGSTPRAPLHDLSVLDRCADQPGKGEELRQKHLRGYVHGCHITPVTTRMSGARPSGLALAVDLIRPAGRPLNQAPSHVVERLATRLGFGGRGGVYSARMASAMSVNACRAVSLPIWIVRTPLVARLALLVS